MNLFFQFFLRIYFCHCYVFHSIQAFSKVRHCFFYSTCHALIQIDAYYVPFVCDIFCLPFYFANCCHNNSLSLANSLEFRGMSGNPCELDRTNNLLSGISDKITKKTTTFRNHYSNQLHYFYWWVEWLTNCWLTFKRIREKLLLYLTLFN